MLNEIRHTFSLGFFNEKTYILYLGMSCFKTQSEKLNNLGQNPKVAVITSLLTSCYPTCRRKKEEEKTL